MCRFKDLYDISDWWVFLAATRHHLGLAFVSFYHVIMVSVFKAKKKVSLSKSSVIFLLNSDTRLFNISSISD